MQVFFLPFINRRKMKCNWCFSLIENNCTRRKENNASEQKPTQMQYVMKQFVLETRVWRIWTKNVVMMNKVSKNQVRFFNFFDPIDFGCSFKTISVYFTCSFIFTTYHTTPETYWENVDFRAKIHWWKPCSVFMIFCHLGEINISQNTFLPLIF